MRKAIALILACIICISGFSTMFISASGMEDFDENGTNIGADDDIMSGLEVESNIKSALLMEADTGTVLYAKNANEPLPPASVTKIMTLLLVAEALENEKITLTQKVSVSANAASKGGSQIFLKEGEEFTVEELLKSTVIASANDAAVALAELIAGSEASFVAQMNARAEELGMKSTRFENATGLDDSVTKHLTSAYDIAVMSKALIKHSVIRKYSSVWQDSIRGGEFILTNTNRLVRYYQGCTGLKTGSTDNAGFCVSATAERDGMHLIAVVMGARTRDERNDCARAMLDYGFSNYTLYKTPGGDLEDVAVKRGDVKSVTAYIKNFSILVNKLDLKRIEKRFNIPTSVTAPIDKEQKIGEIIYLLGDAEIGKQDIYTKEEISEITYFDVVLGIIRSIFVGS